MLMTLQLWLHKKCEYADDTTGLVTSNVWQYVTKFVRSDADGGK